MLSISWELLDGIKYKGYRKTGEFCALEWLNACSQGKTGEPMDLFWRLLNNISNGRSEDPKFDAAFILTILPYCDRG
jgi:hypothetical protein